MIDPAKIGFFMGSVASATAGLSLLVSPTYRKRDPEKSGAKAWLRHNPGAPR